MRKFCFDDIKNHLPELQETFSLSGQAKVLAELAIPQNLIATILPNNNSKLFVFYLGTAINYSNSNYYLFWLENEGGLLANLCLHPDNPILMASDNRILNGNELKIFIDDDGRIGYGYKALLPLEIKITWSIGRPQAQAIKSGQIMELVNVPEDEPMEMQVVFDDKVWLQIEELIFGHPNIINFEQPSGLHLLAYVEEDGTLERWLTDTLYIDMVETGPELRRLIIQAGDVNPQMLEKIIEELN